MMSIRTRTLLIVTLILAALISVCYVTSHTVILDGFSEIEKDSVHQNLKRALAAISETESELRSRAWDWANWDETYVFMADANPDFVRTNPTDKSFSELRINLMLMLRHSGTPAFAKAFDLENQKEVSLPSELAGGFQAGHPLLATDARQDRAGLILLGGKAMLVASRSILTSEGKGPARGTLVMGRFLDAPEMDRLSERLRINVSGYVLGEKDLPEDLEQAKAQLAAGAEFLVWPSAESTVAGYALLSDIHGKPAFLLRALMPRTVYRHGQAVIDFLLLWLLVIGFAFSAAILLLLERLLFSRIASLGRNVSAIEPAREHEMRIPVVGEDELSRLAVAINDMLKALGDSRGELRNANERLQQEIEEHERTEESLRSSQERLRFLSAKLLSIQEQERRHLAQELHDAIGQSLVATKYRLEHFQQRVRAANPEEIIAELNGLIELAQNGINEVRRICTGLRPFILDDFGILAGVEWLCDQFRLACPDIDVREHIRIQEEELPEPLKMAIFRILQEALSNAAKHSKAESVEIAFMKKGGAIELSIHDDGRGFDYESILSSKSSEKGFGLTSMRERTELSGGSFSVRSGNAKGTTIRALWFGSE